MGKLQILPKEVNLAAIDLPHLNGACLPICYMSDYSVLALLVDKFQETVRLLEEHRYFLSKSSAVEVVIENAEHMRKMFQLLQTGGIDFTLSDIADQIYQG
ncbi:MAG: hypothetical protein WBM78_21495 [Desulfobacterales bacterium]